MKSLIVFLMFTTTLGFSQNIHFNLTGFQAYKIPVLNLANPKLADEIARGIEKSQLAELAWIDGKLNEMYIITNNTQLSQILAFASNSYNIKFADPEEINLNNDLFLAVYAQKGGTMKENIPDAIPEIIYFGDQTKTVRLYQTVKEIWVSKYPEKYKTLYSTEEKGTVNTSDHFPKFINTGNPDYDNAVFEQAKREWLKNYPEEYNKVYGVTTK